MLKCGIYCRVVIFGGGAYSSKYSYKLLSFYSKSILINFLLDWDVFLLVLTPGPPIKLTYCYTKQKTKIR